METVEYTPDFVTSPAEVFEELWNGLAWERRGSTPRREYYCNEVAVPYTYGSGNGIRTYEPSIWTPAILGVKAEVEARLRHRFEVCFLNGYEDERDSLGWHADDSEEMDDDRPIAIVTLGAAREIMFCKNGETSSPSRLLLGNGSLCVMAAGMQDTHKHKIPRAGFRCGPRISLTFRGYVTRA